MIRTVLLATAAALLAVSEPFDPPVASADTVEDCLCILQNSHTILVRNFAAIGPRPWAALMWTASAGHSSFPPTKQNFSRQNMKTSFAGPEKGNTP